MGSLSSLVFKGHPRLQNSATKKWRPIEQLDAPSICKCNVNVNINVNVNVEETISNYISIGDSSSLYTYKYRRN